MMKMVYDPELQRGDLSWSGKGLEMDDGLFTMVLLSLFTDARAEKGDRLPLASDYYRRGCWSDALARVARMRRGGRIWTLRAAKADVSAIKDAIFFGNQSLAWMVGLSLVARTECDAWFEKQKLMLLTKLYEPENQTPIFSHIWEVTKYAL